MFVTLLWSKMADVSDCIWHPYINLKLSKPSLSSTITFGTSKKCFLFSFFLIFPTHFLNFTFSHFSSSQFSQVHFFIFFFFFHPFAEGHLYLYMDVVLGSIRVILNVVMDLFCSDLLSYCNTKNISMSIKDK